MNQVVLSRLRSCVRDSISGKQRGVRVESKDQQVRHAVQEMPLRQQLFRLHACSMRNHCHVQQYQSQITYVID
jgi:hypothetical protein